MFFTFSNDILYHFNINFEVDFKQMFDQYYQSIIKNTFLKLLYLIIIFLSFDICYLFNYSFITFGIPLKIVPMATALPGIP